MGCPSKRSKIRQRSHCFDVCKESKAMPKYLKYSTMESPIRTSGTDTLAVQQRCSEALADGPQYLGRTCPTRDLLAELKILWDPLTYVIQSTPFARTLHIRAISRPDHIHRGSRHALPSFAEGWSALKQKSSHALLILPEDPVTTISTR